MLDWISASALIDLSTEGSVKRQRLKVPGHFRCGPRSNPLAAWEGCDVADLFYTESPAISYMKINIRKQFEPLRKENLGVSYLFGTGNSLSDASNFDWSDGYRIVCNTIVKSESTWKSLNPHIIVAADGLYHFSQSSHARKFRSDLIARFRERPALFVYPVRFHAIVSQELQEFSDWLMPMPEGNHESLSVSIDEAGGSPKGIGNILNILLLPIGCSLAKDVRLIGFDGRKAEDKLFWTNSATHSYPDLIEELHREYPAFFQDHVPTNDPLKYVRTYHGDALENRLVEAESLGWQFSLLFESTTAPLQKRYRPEKTPPAKLNQNK